MSGVIVDDNGVPLPHATVEAWVPGPGGAHASTTSDERGKFALDLPPATYSVRAQTKDGYVGPIDVTVEPGRRVDDVTLQLPPATFETDIGNFF
jgi:protocatechuate 3,4-dioxygenase beta subunit